MEDVTEALADQLAELERLLTDLGEREFHAPSRCEDWSVGDVVLHLAQTNELAVASLEDRFDAALDAFASDLDGDLGVEEGAGAAVARDRDSTPAETFRRWRVGSRRLLELVRVRDPSDRVRWLAGDMAVRTLTTTRLTETWIHAEDIAIPLGVELPPTERLWHVARLVWRTVPYSFGRVGETSPGPVSFELQAPDGGRWSFTDSPDAPNRITGSALDLCRVAGQRLAVVDSDLRGEGPDAERILGLLRTFA